jgi:UDP-N-acetylglucosamine/UDP-N-acetylgalactosamine diphosphorylase
MSSDLLDRIRARGVEVPHPCAVTIAPDVNPENIEAGAVLLPGTRLEGGRTVIRAGARVASGGPTLVRNCGLGRGVTLVSGTFEDAVFLDGASFGPSGYARSGTIFEEGASAAHATGVKQTILLPFATLGSNVNFCDALLAGGSGPRDHSEVGSGFIHFNFTPFGPGGDKATPSRFGDVPRGVWLRSPRIFLGGAGGVVGPVEIGYGSVLAAGSVYRRDRGPGVIVYAESLPDRERVFETEILRRVRPRVEKNLRYMADLAALHRYYAEVRLRVAGGDSLQKSLIELALLQLEGALKERTRQLERLGAGLLPSAQLLERERGEADPEAREQRRLVKALARALPALSDPLRVEHRADRSARARLVEAVPRLGLSYLDWVADLPDDVVAAGVRYLDSVVAAYLEDPEGARLVLGPVAAAPGGTPPTPPPRS